MTQEPEFRAWPKTPRLNRDMVVTEKIDGTNAAVIVSDDGSQVWAQSRKRLIEPGDDNYGFAAWVYGNAGALADILGPGHHYGEWWGSGIQRGYGLPKGEKRFSLFNTHRWKPEDVDGQVDGLYVVPELLRWTFDTNLVRGLVKSLSYSGSLAAPGFMRPEGVIVYHNAANACFKVLIENDELPKGLVG